MIAINSPMVRSLTPEGTSCILPFWAVVVLWNGDEIVAFIETRDARSTVGKVLRGVQAGSVAKATAYQVLNCGDPLALQQELLHRFEGEHGRLPRGQAAFGA